MMMHAYPEMYVNRAQDRLGDAFDYAINSCELDGNNFMQMFSGSSIARRMAKGDPKYVLGKSGIEIAKNINKASAETVYRLAKVFCCSVEDLLEH